MGKYSLKHAKHVSKHVSHKIKKHAVEVSKRTAAICFLVVLIVGLIMPAGVGYIIKHSGDVLKSDH